MAISRGEIQLGVCFEDIPGLLCRDEPEGGRSGPGSREGLKQSW